MRRFQTRVFGLVLMILGDRADAEEATQEAFLRAWRRAEAYDPRRGAVATWLLSIARNVAIDRVRGRRSEPVDIDPAALHEGAADCGDSLEEQRIAADDAAQLWAAIATLPAEQRRALLLAAFAGHTAREIGALDGIPIGTVKTRIRMAMLKLHGLLEVRDG